MVELLRFLFSNGWHFVGFLVLLNITLAWPTLWVALIAGAIRPSKT